MMSATCAKPSVRSRCCAAFGEKGASGSSPSTRPVREVVRRRARPSTTAPWSPERTSSKPTCGCARSAAIRPRMALVDLLERQPPLLLHQVDEPEVARAEHDHVAGRRRRSSTRFVGVLRRSPRRPRGRPSRCCSSPAPSARPRCRSSERSTSSSSAVAVALLERRALRLAVVGEDDDLVRPRRVAARALDPAELLVELAQRLERVGPLEPGVVRDLVVARERRVDRGPALASCR